MIHLTYSNRTEELVERLAGTLNVDGLARESLFDPVYLVVPNRHVGEYLKFELAKANGIAANIRTRSFRGLFDEHLAGAGMAFRVAGGPRLEGRILSFLLDEAFLDHADFDPVRSYVYAGGGQPDAVDRRRLQLARELAQLFEEYLATRPEFVLGWPQTSNPLESSIGKTEVWQRRLLLAVLAEGDGGPGAGVMPEAPRPERLVPLSSILDVVSQNELALPRRLFVAGFASLSRSELVTLSALARFAEVFVYAFNPCFEFWEDVDGSRDASISGDTPPLRLWGRVTREAIRGLNELSEGDHHPVFVDPLTEEATLLHQLQHDILMREPERRAANESFRFGHDLSLRLSSCPNVRREAEWVAEQIWSLIQADQVASEPHRLLTFSDIAVVVPPAAISEYRHVFAAALRECRGIPATCFDYPLVERSAVAEALLLLLDLPAGRFTRQEVLRFATHPCLSIATEADFDREAWIRWCCGLGIVHGATRRDHENSYIKKDMYNWDQGIKRLALGVFMADENDGDDRPFRIGKGDYAPYSVSLSERESASQFVSVLRSIITDAQDVLASMRPLREWASTFEDWATAYLRSRNSKEDAELMSCRAALASLVEVHVMDRPVSFRVALEFAKRAITSVTQSDKPGGVTIAPLGHVRTIPFRVLFAVGLSDGQFPTVERLRPLDVRNAKRRPAEWGRRDEDRSLFLEMVMSARDALYLSYVAYSPRSGETVAPSSIVTELQGILEKGYLRDGERGILNHVVSAHRWAEELQLGEPVQVIPVHPEARQETRILSLRRHWETHSGGAAPERAYVQEELSPDAFALLSETLGMLLPPPRAPSSGKGPIHLSIGTIRRFLECPLQEGARVVLGIRGEQDDDVLSQEDEPFATPRGGAMRWLRRNFWESVETGHDDVESFYEREADLRELHGEAPTGLFGEVERNGHRKMLRTWRSLLSDVQKGMPPGAFHIHRFGRAEMEGPSPVFHEPLHFEVTTSDDPESVRAVRIVLQGATGAMWGGHASLVLGYPWTTDTFRDEREFLRCFLDAILLSAANVPIETRFSAILLHAGPKPSAKIRTFGVPGPDASRSYLAHLVGDLLSRVHAYYLPFEAVAKFHRTAGRTSLQACVEEVRARGRTSCRFGPVSDADRYPPLSSEEAAKCVESRFGLYFQSCQIDVDSRGVDDPTRDSLGS